MLDLSDIKNKLTGNHTIVVVCIVAFILLFVAYYVYITYVAPKLNPSYVANKEFLKKGSEEYGVAKVMLFYATWCPLSKKAMPIWHKIKEKYDGKTINGYLLTFEEFNGSDSDDPKISQELDKYKIEGFPSIKILKDNEMIDFDANPTEGALEEFITTVVAKPQSGS
tara:strand:- start:989 stop:1489 length:501 start_codon:yes stop_codon:yes gene_type:complete